MRKYDVHNLPEQLVLLFTTEIHYVLKIENSILHLRTSDTYIFYLYDTYKVNLIHITVEYLVSFSRRKLHLTTRVTTVNFRFSF